MASAKEKEAQSRQEEKDAKARAEQEDAKEQSEEQAKDQPEVNPEDPGHTHANIDHRPSDEPLAQPDEELQVEEPSPNPNELEGKTVVLSETVNMQRAKSEGSDMIALINIQTGEEIEVAPVQWEERRAYYEAGGYRLKNNPTGRTTLTPEAEPWQVSQGTGFIRGTRPIPGQ